MLEIIGLLSIGFVMGIIGGVLGLGGSTIMIPAMVMAFGENQHLYQASAMICNFVVGISSIAAHRKNQTFVKSVLEFVIPAAIVGILLGVAAGNLSVFEGSNSVLLARCFGVFLIYVLAYNCWRMFHSPRAVTDDPDEHLPARYPLYSAIIGILTGFAAGFMGIGAGTVSTPLQQVLLKMPIKRAMCNSAAIIVAVSWVGAIYKNWTLPEHNIAVMESLRITLWIIPTGLTGGYIGGYLMHILPRNAVRIAFIVILVTAIWKLLTVQSR